MRILVVSPHPDDEVLGCGGSLLKFKDEGATIIGGCCEINHHHIQAISNEL